MKKQMVLSVALVWAAATGCGDDEPTAAQGAGGTGAASSSASSQGGTGTAQGGNGGAATSTAGSGGQGGSMGQGGAGGGGPDVVCLGKEVYEKHFALQVDGLCVVAHYTAAHAQGYPNSPSWGRHGGPLTLQQLSSPADSITLTRYTPPAATSGATTDAVSASLGLSIAVNPLYLNSKALDLPGGDLTAVGYDVFGTSGGELLFVDASSVVERHKVNGLYDYAMLPAKGEVGRFLYSALTPLGQEKDAPKVGLYAADICKGQQGFCGKETLVVAGDASGPVAVDGAGNAFAVFPSLANKDQQLRGFVADKVAFKAPADAGVELATLAGTGSALAALAPKKAGDKGYVLFQTSDTNYVPQDPVVVSYTVNGGNMSSMMQKVGIDVVVEGAGVHLLNDAKGRIWLGVGTGMTETTYFVLDHAPMK